MMWEYMFGMLNMRFKRHDQPLIVQLSDGTCVMKAKDQWVHLFGQTADRCRQWLSRPSSSSLDQAPELIYNPTSFGHASYHPNKRARSATAAMDSAHPTLGSYLATGEGDGDGFPLKLANTGTLRNGRVKIMQSNVEAAGRGLFAGDEGFVRGEAITVYGGKVCHRDQPIDARYALRISDSDTVVDGSHFARGINEDADESGLYLPSGGPTAAQWQQGAGSMCNQTSKDHTNAKLCFVAVNSSDILSPRIPFLEATRDIEPGGEICFRYGSSKPLLDVIISDEQQHQLDVSQVCTYLPTTSCVFLFYPQYPGTG